MYVRLPASTDSMQRDEWEPTHMQMILRNLTTFAFVPVVIGYFGALLYIQRHGTRRDLQHLAATLALPVFTTLNTLTVVTRPHTVLTQTISLLWLVLAALGGSVIAIGKRRRSVSGAEQPYVIPALILCGAALIGNIVYLMT